MLFNKKYYDAELNEVNETVTSDAEKIEQFLEEEFRDNKEVASVEYVTLSDGRICMSVKDHSHKIIFQYKELRA
jgi:hypothetical protein